MNNQSEENQNQAANTPKKENQKVNKPKRNGSIHFLRTSSVIVLSLIVFIITSGLIFGLRFFQSITECDSNMTYVLENVEYGYNSFQSKAELSNDYILNKCLFITDLLSDTLNKNGYSASFAASMQDKILDAQLLFFPDNASKDINTQVTKNVLENLRAYGYCYENDSLSTYCKWNGGELVINWLPESAPIEDDLFYYAGDEQVIQIVDTNTWKILRCSDESRVGRDYDREYGDSITPGSEFLYIDQTASSAQDQFSSGISKTASGKYYFYEEKENSGFGLLFAVHVSLSYLIRETLRSTLPQLMLMLLVYLMVVFFAVRVYHRRRKGMLPAEGFNVRSTFHVDTNFTSLISGFLLFGILVSIILTAYLQTLIDYCTRNSRADNNLSAAAEFVEMSLHGHEEILSFYNRICIEELQVLSEVMRENPDLINQTGKLKEQLQVEELVIFDGDGQCIASSSDYQGLSLGNDPDSIYQSLLNGMEISVSWQDENYYYSAVRRTDAPGLIMVKSGNRQIFTLLNNLSVEAAFSCTNFDQADKIFVDLNNPDIVYWNKAGTYHFEQLSLTLDDRLMTGQFTGQIHINGISYTINELLTDNILYISALEGGTVWTWMLYGLLIELAGYALLLLLLVLCLGIYKPTNENTSSSSVLNYEKFSDNIFRRMLTLLLVLTVILLALYIIAEFEMTSNSFLKYLFSSKWERKFNLFSVTMILFAAIVAKLVVAILTKTILLIARNTGPRGRTLGHMFCSLLRFGMLLALILYALVELGLKLSYLLTGAGIIGVVVGYACQGVINDLLSGLFIVFEGSYQVGDWISVGEWRGEVKEIGIRTTKVVRGNDVRIFNNSCLNTITVWGPSMSGALCEVSVDYSCDLDYVLALILGNEENYRKVCPHIADGFGIHGVTKLDDSGVSIRIWASVEDQAYVGSTERGILQETKRLFDENSVTIPFPQVVVHNAD